MGSDDCYPEEAPRRAVRVASFWIDETPVTNRQFAHFVAATGYKTAAEHAPDPADYPGMPSKMAQPGSLVFMPPATRVPLHDATRWWNFEFGADWRHPLGKSSSIAGLADHPVVQITCTDAAAYALWAGKSLPTEAEWEFAARAGATTEYAWGVELAPGGRMMANYWQGEFPWQNLKLDGWERTSPVRSYPPNAFGLYDMIGNVWEWTDDWYGARRKESKAPEACCVPENPRGAEQRESYDPDSPVLMPRKVLKGGSHLCAANYCQRYRPSARYPQPIDTSTSHIGFRCVVRDQSLGSTTL